MPSAPGHPTSLVCWPPHALLHLTKLAVDMSRMFSDPLLGPSNDLQEHFAHCNVNHASGPVAQWIRHRPTEPGIAGSSPAGVILFSCPDQRGSLQCGFTRGGNGNKHGSHRHSWIRSGKQLEAVSFRRSKSRDSSVGRASD